MRRRLRFFSSWGDLKALQWSGGWWRSSFPVTWCCASLVESVFAAEILKNAVWLRGLRQECVFPVKSWYRTSTQKAFILECVYCCCNYGCICTHSAWFYWHTAKHPNEFVDLLTLLSPPSSHQKNLLYPTFCFVTKYQRWNEYWKFLLNYKYCYIAEILLKSKLK